MNAAADEFKGELLTLQWQDVRSGWQRGYRALILRAGKTKTGAMRSCRWPNGLAAVLRDATD